MIKLNIKTGKNYEYLMKDGLLANAGTLIADSFDTEIPEKLAIVTDDTVASLYAGDCHPFIKSLKETGFEVFKYVFPHGEASKDFQTLSDLMEFLASNKVALARNDAIIALGGGIAGDLAGFAASIYMRGIPFVQIPTSLLAAVDSSVGGKTAVNLAAGKNLAGSFHQPELVLFDSSTLRSLPKDRMLEGLAEVIKSAVIGDKDLFSFTANNKDILSEFTETGGAGSAAAVKYLVRASVTVKADTVSRDERENGLRQILNFGHTIGHAIEKCSGFEISHGFAVATGMNMITKSAAARGLADKQLADTLEKILTDTGFDLECPYSSEALAEAALADKKRRKDRLTLAIAPKAGECLLHDIPVNELANFIDCGR